MIELFFKIRGGNAPPALPVADPMHETTSTTTTQIQTPNLEIERENDDEANATMDKKITKSKNLIYIIST